LGDGDSERGPNGQTLSIQNSDCQIVPIQEIISPQFNLASRIQMYDMPRFPCMDKSKVNQAIVKFTYFATFCDGRLQETQGPADQTVVKFTYFATFHDGRLQETQGPTADG